MLTVQSDETTIDESNSDDEYQALSNREEYDLEKLMQQCEFTIDNAQAFTEKLSKDSAQMDSQNIEKIMASEKAVERLMSVLQMSIDETVNLEKKIDNYLGLLKSNNDVIMQVGMKENQVKTEQENKKKLELFIEDMIGQLDFPMECERQLLENDLSSKQGIKECIKAAERLQLCLNANLHPTMSYIVGVQEQKAYLEKVQLKFSDRLTSHIINEFNYYVRMYQAENANAITHQDLTLPKHELIHNGLFVYQPLVKWLNNINPDYFLILTDKYESEMKHVYDQEMASYFEVVKERMAGSSRAPRKSVTSYLDNFDTVSSKDSEISMSEWEEFDSCLVRVLSAIDPVCLAEQKFCMQFFNIDNSQPTGVSTSATRNSLSSSIVTTSTGTAGFSLHRRVSNVSANNSISHSISNESQNSNSNETERDRRAKSLRDMNASVFGNLEQEFLNFIIHYDNIETMYLLVRLTHHVLEFEDKSSFLAKIYGNVLINVKRNFDKFMNSQLNEIEQAKITKKPKCGVFPFLKRFQVFAEQAENIYKSSGARRTDIDKWYKILINKMFEQITNLAKQHHKTPEEMIALENYHYLHNVLMTLKIACLDQERKETKSRYNEALKDYVSRYFGRPLEKLNAFFKGVQQKVQQGVKEEEVGYQLAFSKQELRKNIEECSLKEVKKGLEEMYRKVGKHISDPDSTLIQVIWRSMQEEFITQYKAIENLIQRCYPDANIKLSFSVEDVLNVFSSIAQQQK